MGYRSSCTNLLKIRNKTVREFAAEFLGTFILIIFGNGSVAQYVLSDKQLGSFLSINWAWCIGVIMGVYVAGNVSGGHINPAVSLTMAVLGRLKWWKAPLYMLAQYLGAFVASCCVYGVYADALDNYDGGVRHVTGPNATAGIWSTYPQDYVSTTSALADQILGTAMLVACVLAITDEKNSGPPRGLAPVCVGLVVLVIGASYGLNCGYAINPARDLSPRLFTAMAGWGIEVFSFRGYNWFWVPVVGPHIGALIGALVYQLLVGIHWPNEDTSQALNDSATTAKENKAFCEKEEATHL